LLSDYNEGWNLSTNLHQIFQHKIHCKQFSRSRDLNFGFSGMVKLRGKFLQLFVGFAAEIFSKLLK